MKSFVFILILFGCAVPLVTRSQHVTLHLHHAPLEKALADITHQTGTLFLYSDNLMQKARPVSLDLKRATIAEALAKCFEHEPLAYRIVNGTVVITGKENPTVGKANHIYGLVTSSGEPLPGVSVSMPGGMNGTTTNSKGEYLLSNVSFPATIEFSCVGYAGRRVTLDTATFYHAELTASSEQLEQAIVEGYYTTTKRFATGSSALIFAKDIGDNTFSDPLAAMEGRMPGIFISQLSGAPGTAFKVEVRGSNSIQSGTDPLYILDGVPFGPGTLTETIGGGGGITRSPLDMINPDDIASIQVLKDADATAIYGSRGANGVVLITTKDPHGGKAVTDINISSGAGWITRKLNLMDANQYLNMRYEGFRNDGVDWRSPSVAAPDLKIWDTSRYTDWQKFLLGNTARFDKVNISLGGGNGRMNFRISTSYDRSTTVYPMWFGEDKWSTNIALTNKSPGKKIVMSFKAGIAVNKNRLPQSDLVHSIFLPPVAPPLFTTGGDLNWADDTWQNPLRELLAVYSSVSNNLFGNLSLNCKLSPFLQWQMSFGFNHLDDQDVQTTPLAFYAPSTRAVSQSSAIFLSVQLQTFIAEPRLTYARNLGASTITVIFGGSYQHTTQRALGEEGIGFPSDVFLENLQAASFNHVIRSSISDYKYLAGFMRLNFDRSKKYLLSLTARRDGSSRFGAERPFSNFGAIGAGWIFSEEKMLSGLLSLISFGKLRGSIGVTGNDQVGNYNYLSTYDEGRYQYDSSRTLEPTRAANSGFRWEKVSKLEAALELGFARNQILVEVSWYRNQSQNQLVNMGLPGFTGFTNVLANSGARLRNSGMEATISSVNVNRNSWTFSTNIVFSMNKNRIIEYPGLAQSSNANILTLGRSLDDKKLFHFIGVNPATGIYQFQDVDHDGRVSYPDDYIATAASPPKYFGGITNSLRYRNIQCEVFIQVAGQQAKTILNDLSTAGDMQNQPVELLNRWQQPGDITRYQRYSAGYGEANAGTEMSYYSDLGTGNASYVRLRSIRFSYSFSKKSTKLLRLNSMKIFLVGENVFTWSKYFGLDPETALHLPPLRTVGGGVQVSF